MSIPRALTIVISILTLAILLGVGYVVAAPRGAALVDANFGLDGITPNADGVTDITQINYRLRRQAIVSIYLEVGDGERFYFRKDQVRTRGRYEVLFSGIVDGYTLPGEEIQGEVLTRLVPDGQYMWGIQAEDLRTGRVDVASGPFVVADADSELPDLWEFTLSPTTFTTA
jgi:hypothetical protein